MSMIAEENTFPPEMERLLSQLLPSSTSKEECSLAENEITNICKAAIEVLRNQSTVLEIGAPIKIVGDLHGQYEDLKRILDLGLHPPESNYLFLGNYVGRGKMSIETVCTLLLLKLKYPENVFLLRGNHECARINRFYGFYDECIRGNKVGRRKYSVQLWKQINECFGFLPLCAVVEDKIFCVHGGLSPELEHSQQIYQIQRPCDIPEKGMICDLLWSDPNHNASGWTPNERGISVKFGADILERFLARNELDLMVRGHQLVQDGYEFFAEDQMVTLFSASNYAGEFDNAGAFMIVNETLECTFQLTQPNGKRSICRSEQAA